MDLISGLNGNVPCSGFCGATAGSELLMSVLMQETGRKSDFPHDHSSSSDNSQLEHFIISLNR
jgi:hypothetical protein